MKLHSQASAVATLLACLLVPGLADAHAVLRKTEPAQRAQLSRPPSAVRLWFSEPLEAAFSSASVAGAAGNEITHEPARLSAQDARLLELNLPGLSPGQYTVRYQVLSVDGHTVKGSFTFRLKDGAAQK